MNEITSVFPDSRPIVRAREYRWAPWIFASVVGLGGILLFTSLESSRHGREDLPLARTESDVAASRSLPELAVPPVSNDETAASQYYAAPPSSVRLFTSPAPARAVVVRVPQSLPSQALRSFSSAPIIYPSPLEAMPVSPAPAFPSPNSSDQRAIEAPGRIHAQRLAAPTYTIAKGTLIPAVMETAMDSTRPGQVRAIVSRDVHGFDGERVLIPRGSRLVGEYQADIAQGQNRAMVSWTRLVRPDGVTIELRSPASDALGRAGVRGTVNNHTFQRLTNVVLQTAMNVGSGLTQRAIASPVIVIPGGSQSTPIITNSNSSNIQPTLTVPQGARVSVFVANDLDFSDVDNAR